MVKIREDKGSSVGLASLESLYINDANLSIITSYDLIGFPNLKTLSLRNNRIENVLPSALRPLPMLCELDLSTNRIDTLPEERLTGLVWLTTLNLSRNNLLEVPHLTADLHSLQTLDLSFNGLTRVQSFGRLGPSVAHISLRHNAIASIATNAFHNMTQLKSLDLRQNLLTQLSAQLFEALEVHLQSIMLSGMPTTEPPTHLAI
jgi:Leucine-rich repeat (LRR) protein